jgi:hypothetical protein
MIYLSYGLPKSASTFSFYLAKAVAEAAGHDQQQIRNALPESLRGYYLSLEASSLDELVDRVTAPKFLVAKTHAPLTPEIERHLDAGTAIASVSFRDPRDVAVALLDAGVNERRKANGREAFRRINGLEDTLAPMREHLSYLQAWLRRDDVLRLPFDLLAERPLVAAARIAAQMGLDVDSQSIGEHLFHARGQIPEYNVGKKGRYRQVMTAAEQASFTAEFQPEIAMIEMLTAEACRDERQSLADWLPT